MTLYIILALGILAAAALAYTKRKKSKPKAEEQKPKQYYLDRLKGSRTKFLWTGESRANPVGLGPNGGRYMNGLSEHCNASHWDTILRNLKRTRCNSAYLYALCDGDGHGDVEKNYGGYPKDLSKRYQVNFYVKDFNLNGGLDPQWGRMVSPERVAAMRKRIQTARQFLSDGRGEGRIFLWFNSDQSKPTLGAQSLQLRLKTLEDVHEHFGDLIDCLVLGLEANEEFPVEHHTACANRWKEISTVPVGCHLGTWKDLSPQLEAAYVGPCDVYLMQHHTGLAPSEIARQTRMVIERYPGKPIIASEFARMGDDPMSDKQAAAAIGVGAWGTGT